ncbi:Ig-like domain-containing protein [Geotalea sp. SG265]|uniref:Ig-like domain-containing protein n=1 Tax=Geotalea sp. SG265 TaxID=2922867 RepID=UPI001FAE8926|nr:Ig-like domain-containing protein [Geotalea sp. SG265]
MGGRLGIIAILIAACVMAVGFAGCGGGGGGSSAPAATVSGVAATGAPMTGTAFLKDSANSPEMSTTIQANTGAFSFNVTGKTPPFILRSGSSYSMSGGSGTANINPLSNLMVADMGAFGNISSLNTFYRNPDANKMRTMFGNMSSTRQQLRLKFAPLMNAYGVANADPMAGPFTIGQGLDKMFDDVKMTIDANGNVTMMYINGTQVFTGKMGNMPGGTMMAGNIMAPGTVPPSGGITITPSMAKLQVSGTQQFTANAPVTWSVVGPSGGTISPTGLYMAPSFTGMFLVKATSIADPTKSATVTVQVGNMGMMM